MTDANKAPERIWLQWDNGRDQMFDGATWCAEPQEDDDVGYIRSDLCASGQQVRALVWVKSHIRGWNGDYHTVPTGYTVRCADENGWKWAGIDGFGYSTSPDAAKAAAQENHTRYILAALTTAPEAAQTEAVAWFTEDAQEDQSATTWSKAVADRWLAKGWPVTPLFTHPPAAHMTPGDAPAFPVTAGNQVYATGLTLRDWFAGQFMQGLAADPTNHELFDSMDEMAVSAYAAADAMLAAIQKEKDK